MFPERRSCRIAIRMDRHSLCARGGRADGDGVTFRFVYCFFSIFAQESLSVTVRLNTG